MKTLALAFFVLAAGCASTPTSTTNVTSADMAPPASRESTPRDSTFPGETPKGQLTCRAATATEGTVELYLVWGSTSASGTLRRKAQSGAITEQKVHAERVQGAIVADDVLSTDLVVHAAMIREHKGHTFVRLGDWKQGWTRCQ